MKLFTSLKQKLLLSYGVVAVLPLLIWGMAGLYAISNSMEREIGEKSQTLADSIAREMEEFLDVHLRMARQMADIACGNQAIAEDKVDDYLTRVQKNQPFFELLLVVDRNGMVTHTIPTDANFNGIDMTYQTYYSEARRSGEPYWSETFISAKSGRPTVSISVPSENGMIIGFLSLSYMDRIIKKVKLGTLGYACILDRDDTIIAHPMERFVQERRNVKSVNLVKRSAEAQGARVYTFDGEGKIGCSALINPTNWVAIVTQPVHEAFAPVARMRNIIFFSILAAVALAVGAAFYSRRMAMSPLEMLVSDTERIANGDYTHSFRQPSYQEIAALEGSFAKMLAALKKRESDLLESESRYRALVMMAPMPLVEMAHDGKTIGYNECFIKTLGYTIEDIPSIDYWWPLGYPDQEYREFAKQRWAKMMEQALANNETVVKGDEYLVHCKDGTVRNMIIGASIVGDRVLVSLFDISEVKKAELALRASEERLSMAFSAATDGLWDWNIKTNQVYYSPRYYTMLGYEKGDFPEVYESWRQLIHEEDLAKVDKLLKDYFSGKAKVYNIELRMKAKNGEWRWILTRGQVVERDGQGNPARMVGTHVDITAQKMTENALRASEENLRVTLDSIGDAVVSTDMAGTITRMNLVAERLTGWNAGEAKGRPLAGILSLMDAETRQPIESSIERVIKTGRISSLGKCAILGSKTGREYLIDNSGAPIRNDAGDIIGAVVVFRDITEEHALQEHLRQAQKMEAIGQLAGGVAHDFNNMLGGILAAAEVLSRRLADAPEKQRDMVRLIMDSARRAADLTAKLQTFSRKMPTMTMPIDIKAPIRDAIALLERTADKRIKIVTDYGSNGSTIKGDHAQLQSMFLNIFINATHAMPEGGVIGIKVRERMLEDHECGMSSFGLAPGGYVEVEISDTGCGISPEILPRIFEPFFTTKDVGKGTGLGLAAVFGTVKQHHGAIHVQSEVGMGSIFHILLPLANTEAAGTQVNNDGLVLGSGRILFIDDEVSMRMTSCAILEELGYEVMSAENGIKGLELFRAEKGRFDLVMLDMVMPEMSGRDCFYALKALEPGVRVILSSGFTRDATVESLMADGLAGFIRKPFSGPELSRMVARAIRRASA